MSKFTSEIKNTEDLSRKYLNWMKSPRRLRFGQYMCQFLKEGEIWSKLYYVRSSSAAYSMCVTEVKDG